MSESELAALQQEERRAYECMNALKQNYSEQTAPDVFGVGRGMVPTVPDVAGSGTIT
jgi:hypothetical protein